MSKIKANTIENIAGDKQIPVGDMIEKLNVFDPQMFTTAWGSFNGNDSTIYDGYNFASITNISTGVYEVKFERSMENTNYTIVGSAEYDGDVSNVNKSNIFSPEIVDTETIRISTHNYDGNFFNCSNIYFVVFGGKTTFDTVNVEIFPQSGSNENGNWIKHADGTLVQWGKATSRNSVITFPTEFIDDNASVVATAKYTSVDNGIQGVSVSNITSQSCQIDFAYGVACCTEGGTWQAIGKWK